jgi:Type II CAAX prenyl endopeptidase Rce1-like
MADSLVFISGLDELGPGRSRRRILLEFAISYALILLVIWTPRSWQKVLWWFAAAAVLVIAGLAMDNVKNLGLSSTNFVRSLWITGAALVLSAIGLLIALNLGTLQLPPGGAAGFIKAYWVYALWACVQQLLLQGFFLPRCIALTKSKNSAAILAASLFALAHLPNPILTPVTFLWGLAACLVFLRHRNVFPLAMAHAVLGISVAITVPAFLLHNMRVGLGYLTYRPHAETVLQLSKP